MKSKPGLIILLAGVLCVTAAAGLFVFNTVRSAQAGNESRHAVEVLTEVIGKEASKSHNLPTDDPDREMPAIEVEGERYLGILDIPALGLTLPVGESLDDDALQSTPCRYSGSIYDRTMQIGATTQKGQYDFYRSLSVGDTLYLTDMEGNRFSYSITDIKYSKKADSEALTRKKSSLTLFIKNIYSFEYIILYCN